MSTNESTARHLLRRLTNLYVGLALYGMSTAILVRAGLGLPAWDVLHQGLARRTGLPFGWIVISTGAVTLLLWVPLRQHPGLGTISNVLLVGLAAQAALALTAPPSQLAVRAGWLVCGVLLNGLATALYIGARLGPGPRDGLMTGLAARGHSIRVVRTVIELLVLACGWLLGGTAGVGTLLYAVAIGPLTHHLLPRLTIAPQGARPCPDSR